MSLAVATRFAEAAEPVVTAREEVRRGLAAFVRPVGWKAVLHFTADYLLYAAALAGVLFLAPLWAKLICSVLAGVKIANLATLGHDGAHGNLTASARWNKGLTVLSFMPGLYNYRLWVYDHHYVHHPFVNGRHRDSWVPYSKEQFDAMSGFRRLRERFYRAPLGIGFAVYYIVERWWQVKFFPRAFIPARFRPSAWRHFALLMVYLTAFLAALALAPRYSPTGPATALLLGFALPFYVWMALFSFTVYVHHTHPAIPWFDGPVDRRALMPQERLSAHLEFSRWFRFVAHHIHDHAAHHANPRIPFHRLAAAQQRLGEIVGDGAVVDRFSFRWFNDTLRRCKLYDYEAHCWLDFDGRPTAAPALSEAERLAVRRTGGTMFSAQS